MVAFSRAFVFRLMIRDDRQKLSSEQKKSSQKLTRNNCLDTHAQNMGYLDDKGNLTDLGKRLWHVLASDKNNNVLQ